MSTAIPPWSLSRVERTTDPDLFIVTIGGDGVELRVDVLRGLDLTLQRVCSPAFRHLQTDLAAWVTAHRDELRVCLESC